MDNRAEAALAEAGKLLAHITGQCPALMYSWDHPDQCFIACKTDMEPECWRLYCLDRAERNPEFRKGTASSFKKPVDNESRGKHERT